MPTAIAVTSADLVLPPSDRQTPAAAVLPGARDQSLDSAVDHMQALLEQRDHVIVVHSAAVAAEEERRLRMVRAVLESDRIALLSLDLPPLGVAVVVRQLRQLAGCDFSPGVLASAGRLLAHYVYTGAVLGSVAKLDRIPVGLKAHVKGWLPGARFAVLAGPEPRLAEIGQGADVPPGPGFATRLLVARGRLGSDWPETVLAPAWQVTGAVEEVPLPAGSARWWGTTGLVEFAAHLPDVSVLYQLVASVRRENCHWCGLELIGDRCGFCSAPLRPVSAPPGPAPGTVRPDSATVRQGPSRPRPSRSLSRPSP
ncbi:hypothetical protein NX801_02365 [Streptomyces sp. LP05-1]|uniref:Uncharacterized protein n=1 Tax=Streptomyces pyxinae TaxID=2970734 RepID=A0ABT2CAU5_9ACTN|nr:hypothetical protein [Streptomyces sp. LP05-1]MCS0634525.1 hypothetical protein [Streptomyces sp. LP05-1]